MSKFTEEWQATKKSLDHMVGVMESMAAKYGECTDIEEIAKKKGFTEGYNLGIKKQKEEICENCYHKATAEKCCDYSFVITLYAKLPARQRDVVLSLMQELSRDNEGGGN